METIQKMNIIVVMKQVNCSENDAKIALKKTVYYGLKYQSKKIILNCQKRENFQNFDNDLKILKSINIFINQMRKATLQNTNPSAKEFYSTHLLTQVDGLSYKQLRRYLIHLVQLIEYPLETVLEKILSFYSEN